MVVSPVTRRITCRSATKSSTRPAISLFLARIHQRATTTVMVQAVTPMWRHTMVAWSATTDALPLKAPSSLLCAIIRYYLSRDRTRLRSLRRLTKTGILLEKRADSPPRLLSKWNWLRAYLLCRESRGKSTELKAKRKTAQPGSCRKLTTSSISTTAPRRIRLRRETFQCLLTIRRTPTYLHSSQLEALADSLILMKLDQIWTDTDLSPFVIKAWPLESVRPPLRSCPAPSTFVREPSPLRWVAWSTCPLGKEEPARSNSKETSTPIEKVRPVWWLKEVTPGALWLNPLFSHLSAPNKREPCPVAPREWCNNLTEWAER